MENLDNQLALGNSKNLRCGAIGQGPFTAHIGKLAEATGLQLPIIVMRSAAGYYLGTERFDDEMEMTTPYTRESIEYWPTKDQAEEAMTSGSWNQKPNL